MAPVRRGARDRVGQGTAVAVRWGSTALLAGAFALLLPVRAHGQAVEGIVRDEATGKPVEAALVAVVDAAGNQVARSETDAAGRYLLSGFGPGEYTLRAGRFGYTPLQSMLLRIEAGQTFPVDFDLFPDPIALPGVAVEVDARSRVRSELALWGVRLEDIGKRYIDQATIEKLPGLRDVGEVIERQGIPGVDVSRRENLYRSRWELLCVTQVRGRTGTGADSCMPVILNGAAISLQSAALVPVESLRGAVILRPNEATLMLGTRGAAGALLLFTRDGR